VWKFVEKVRVRQDDLINTSVAYFSIEKTHVFSFELVLLKLCVYGDSSYSVYAMTKHLHVF
jgi:hypothetical protein